MKISVDHQQVRQHQRGTDQSPHHVIRTPAAQHICDNRPAAVTQRKFQALANHRTNSLQMKRWHAGMYPLAVHPMQLQESSDKDTEQQSSQERGVNIDESNIDTLLSTLRLRVDVEANKILAQINQTTEHCPYISKWFQYYSDKDVRHIVDAVERFAPKTRLALTFDEYIECIVDRVKTGLLNHVRTGSIRDVPDEIIDEQHAPEDFLHIAEKNEPTIQRSCLKDCFKPKTYEPLTHKEEDVELKAPTKRRSKTHGIDQGNGVIAYTGDGVINVSTTTCGLVIAYSDDGIACYHWPFISNDGKYFSAMDFYVEQIGRVTNIDVFSNRQPFEDSQETLKGIKSRYSVPVRFYQPVPNQDNDPWVTLGINSSTSNYGNVKMWSV